MGIIKLTDKLSSLELDSDIDICKSDSGVCGVKLREAHYYIACSMANVINCTEDCEKYAIVIFMRAGLSFGLGIADTLEKECKQVQIFFSTKEKEIPEGLIPSDYGRIILVDAVIKTGHSMLRVAGQIGEQEKIIFATNVLDETGIVNFEDRRVYTTRVSKHSFTGTTQKEIKAGKGPDTGDRLFNSLFYLNSL